MSDLDVLMDLMGDLEDIQMELSHSEMSMDMYYKMREHLNVWIDQVIYLIDEYEDESHD